MNKNIIIGAIILLLAGGAGFYFFSKSKTISTQSPAAVQPETSVFTSIKDALAKAISLECDFSDQTGHQTKSYIKNGAIRADITAADPKQSGSVIIKDQKMYFWNSVGGFTMDVPNESPTPGANAKATANPSGLSAAGMIASVEQYKDSCKPSVVSDDLFTPPANVKFQDFSKVMQQTAPAVTGVPTINYQQYLPSTTPSKSGY